MTLTTVGVLAAVSSPAALAASGPSHTITGATALPLSKSVTGGGSNIDFWKVQLTGGYNLSIDWSTTSPAGYYHYNFELYAPGTTDKTFTNGLASPVTAADAPATPGPFTIQAPYTGDFILAVCEYSVNGYNPPSDCTGADPASGNIPPNIIDPMSPYVFAGTVTDPEGITTTQGHEETRAAQSIGTAPHLSAFESGGGATIDFWKVQLKKHFKLSLHWTTATTVGYFHYNFELYPPDTTMAKFSAGTATPVAAADAPGSPGSFTLTAPSAGDFILAVCEYSVNGYNPPPNCTAAAPPGGVALPPNIVTPMSPYTFTTNVPPQSKPFSGEYCLAYDFFNEGVSVSSGTESIEFATNGTWTVPTSSDTGSYTYDSVIATLTFTDTGDQTDGSPQYELVGLPSSGFSGLAVPTDGGSFANETGSATATPGACT